MKIVIKIINRCNNNLKFWKILTKAYLMNGMNKFNIINWGKILFGIMIFIEQDGIQQN